METKHTPGPWRLLRPTVGVDANWHVADSGDTFVAHVFGFAHSTDEQARVNARLIAAAPELLEALHGLLQDTQHKEHDCGDTEWCPVIRAKRAIALATGEEPPMTANT